jgi:hypothetical protein
VSKSGAAKRRSFYPSDFMIAGDAAIALNFPSIIERLRIVARLGGEGGIRTLDRAFDPILP